MLWARHKIDLSYTESLYHYIRYGYLCYILRNKVPTNIIQFAPPVKAINICI